MTKVIKLELPDDVYAELEERAKNEGFALVSDYLREIISRELGKSPFNPRALESRLEKLERGELPPKLYDAIWQIVEEVLASKLPETLGSVEGASVVQLDEDEIANKVYKKVERKVQELIIPWTQKIDEIARRLADIKEEVDELKEEVKAIKEGSRESERAPTIRHREREEQQSPRAAHRQEGREERRFTAIDRLRMQGAVFEDELRTIRAKDFFFRKLERAGAKILHTEKHGRIAVDPEAWEEFLRVLDESTTGEEEEVLEKLDKEALKKLFMALREEGILIFDSASRRWTITEL